ncbi:MULTISPECIES: cytidine deaminase-like fold-containing protein [Providencia]
MLSQELYHKQPSELSEDEKATVSAFASLAAGIAGGLVGGDSSSAANAAEAGKTTVENNYLSKDERKILDKALDDQEAGKNLKSASLDIIYLIDKDKYTNSLIDRNSKGLLNEKEQAVLTEYLNAIGVQLQLRGVSEADALKQINVILNDTNRAEPVLDEQYNKALSQLSTQARHEWQAMSGTDTLLAGSGRISQLMRLALISGGSYQTGTGLVQIADGKIAEGSINVGLGGLAVSGGYLGNKVTTGKPNGGIISPETTIVQESSKVLDKKTHTSIPKVEAELIDKETGKIFKDTNQGNRPDYFLGDKSRPTLINDRIEAKVEKNPSKYLPNGDMASAHAEIGTIQQAFEDGITVGRDMNMKVTKEPVCGYCRGDIAAMADKAGLKSLTVYEESTGKILYWNPGMKSLKAKK